MGALSRSPIVPLIGTAFLAGLLGVCLMVLKLNSPLRASKLRSVSIYPLDNTARIGKDSQTSAREEYLASRAAIGATHRGYNLRTVVDALLMPPKSTDYSFREEVYRRRSGPTSLQFTRSLGGEVAAEDDNSGGAPRIDPEGTGEKEPDVWSPDSGEATTRTELEDILLVNLPLLVFFSVLFCAVEIAAMLARRGRDWMLQTELWKLSESAFRAQVVRIDALFLLSRAVIS